MSNRANIKELVMHDCKGITPKYVDKSNIIVLNQKCIRDFQVDYSKAKYVEKSQKIAEEKYIKLGDILINSTGQGTAGRCAVVTYIPDGYKVTVDTHILIMRCKEETYAYCMAYNLYCNESYVMGLLTGSSGQAELDRVRLYNLNIPVPDNFETRKKVKEIICNIENKIEVNTELINYETKLLKTIFNYWFLQFEFPNEEGKAYASNGGEFRIEDSLKIPKTWWYGNIGKFIEANRGISYEDKNLVHDGIPMINLNSFNIDSSYKVDGIKYYEGEYTTDKRLQPYELVMCNTQQTDIDPTKDIIGKTFLVPDIYIGDVVSTHHVTTIKVKTDELKVYFNYLFNTDFFHQYIVGFTNGTSIRGLDFDGVINYKTYIPEEKILKRFYKLAMEVEKRKSMIFIENQKLEKLRDTIIPSYLMMKV